MKINFNWSGIQLYFIVLYSPLIFVRNMTTMKSPNQKNAKSAMLYKDAHEIIINEHLTYHIPQSQLISYN